VESARNNLLEALKQVERRTENSASGWRLLLYGMVLVPVMAVVPEMLWGVSIFDVPEYSAIPFVPTIVLGSLSLLSLAVLYSVQTRRKVRMELETSTVAVRLASGELAEDPIFTRTPWPWRLLVPGAGEQPPVAEIIRRVAWNLDWYLRPPKSYWRFNWILMPLCAVLSLFFLGIPFMNWLVYWLYDTRHIYLPRLYWYFSNQGGDAGLRWNLILLGVLATLPICFIHYRRQIWTEELVRHLHERLQA
jgi:hypothetical protein